MFVILIVLVDNNKPKSHKICLRPLNVWQNVTIRTKNLLKGFIAKIK